VLKKTHSREREDEMKTRYLVLVFPALLAVMLAVGCGATEPQTVVITKEVEKEVVVTKEVEKEVVVTATPEPGEGTLARIQAKNAIFVGFNFEIPYDYISEEGEFLGFDPDVIKYCAKDYLGVDQVIPVQTPWDGLIPGLLAQHYDVIGAGMARTPKRMEVIDFTDAVWFHGSNAVVMAGNPNDIHGWEDIVAKNLRVGATMGGVDIEHCKEIGLGDHCISYTDYASSVTDLRAGRIDVIVGAELLQRRYIQDTNATDIEIAKPWNYDETWRIGLGLRPEDDDLREALNACIQDMKENGELAKILVKYGLSEDNVVQGQE
jgi:polar amino acid transport system substrate-binding protein